MCNTCNNTGGINIEHSWGLEIQPCPNTNCNFEREKAWQETLSVMDQKIKQMKLSESA